MLFVRETSKGIVAVSMSYLPGNGLAANISTPDGDGWAEESARWSAKWDDEGDRRPEGRDEDSLAGALVEAIGLPPGEAAELAHAVISGFKARGGVKQDRADTAKGFALVTAIGLGVLAVVAVVVALILIVIGVLS